MCIITTMSINLYLIAFSSAVANRHARLPFHPRNSSPLAYHSIAGNEGPAIRAIILNEMMLSSIPGFPAGALAMA
jgi:hypothetical protein